MSDNKLIDIKAILELLKDWKIALATAIATLVLFILKIKHTINYEQNISILIIGLFVYSLIILLLSLIQHIHEIIKNNSYNTKSKIKRLNDIFCDFSIDEYSKQKIYKHILERDLLVYLYVNNVKSFNLIYIKDSFKTNSKYIENILNILTNNKPSDYNNKLIKFEKGKYTIDNAVWKELKKYKENDKVINAVQAHHGDVEPQTIEAVLVQAADAISASRPGARRETLENYIKRLEALENIADSFDGVEKSFAIQAGREVRIVVKPEKISDDQMTILARDVAKKVENEMDYPGQIKVNIIRETRVVDYAK